MGILDAPETTEVFEDPAIKEYVPPVENPTQSATKTKKPVSQRKLDALQKARITKAQKQQSRKDAFTKLIVETDSDSEYVISKRKTTKNAPDPPKDIPKDLPEPAPEPAPEPPRAQSPPRAPARKSKPAFQLRFV